MKRNILLIAVLAFLAAALSSCTGQKAPEPQGSDGRLRIVATIFPAYDFARQTGGEDADVTMLLKPGEEVHSYEPTPMDIKMIRDCDLFIFTGGENDVWVERILDTMDDPPKTFRMIDVVETFEEEHTEGMQEERGEGNEEDEEDEGEIDEHVWTSPVNAALITEAIAETMCALDPEHEDGYRERAAEYVEEIEELDREFRELTGNARRDTIVFGDRFPIRYFVEEYGLRYFAAFPGCASETEPSAATMAFLIDKVRKEQIPVVFSIELSNENIAKAIAESSDAVHRTYHTCHNVTRAEFEGGETYVTLMRRNLAVLREALE